MLNVEVKALVDGVYGYYSGNGAKMKARTAKTGELVTVAGGAYAASLVADGFVELTGKEPAAPVPAPVAKAAPKRRR